MASFAPFVFSSLGGSAHDPVPLATEPGTRRPVLMELTNDRPGGRAAAARRRQTAPAPPPPHFTQSELDAAVAEAARAAALETEQRVRADVLAEAEQRVERQIAQALERCAEALAAMTPAVAAAQTAGPDAALVLALVRAIVPHALERAPLADVEAMLVDLLRGLEGEPRLELELAPALVEQGRHLALELARRSGFAGEIAVGARPDLEPGDAHVVWRDGRAERRIEDVAREVETMLARLPDEPRGGSSPTGEREPDHHHATGAAP